MKASDIWDEFITELRSGVFPVDRIVPYPGLEYLADKIGHILRHLTPALLSAAGNRIDPDIYIVKEQIHFILPLETNVRVRQEVQPRHLGPERAS